MDTGLLCRDSEIGTNKVHNQEGVTSLISSPIYGIHDLKIKEQIRPITANQIEQFVHASEWTDLNQLHTYKGFIVENANS